MSEQQNKKAHKKRFSIFFARLCLLSLTPRYVYKFTSTAESVFRVIHKSSSFSSSFFQFFGLLRKKPIFMLPTVFMIIITKRSKLFFKLWYFLSNYTSPETLKKAKWIYRVSQKFVPLLYNFSTIGLGKQITETKFVFQSNSPFSYLLCQFFDSNIRFVHFRAKGARARVYFPATYFLYSIARIARTPSLIFVNITKDNSP